MELTPKVRCALAVARQYPENLGHVEQVARVCERLFDALRPLHGLGDCEGELLLCAALLHDIGLSLGLSGHHRTSFQLILQAELPALSAGERLIVANVARYHRKSHPSPRHEHFAELAPPEQETVRRLAALLRVADGLDRAHENAVTDADASPAGENAWIIRVSGSGDLDTAIWGASRKAGLFEEVYGVKLRMAPAHGRG